MNTYSFTIYQEDGDKFHTDDYPIARAKEICLELKIENAVYRINVHNDQDNYLEEISTTELLDINI